MGKAVGLCLVLIGNCKGRIFMFLTFLPNRVWRAYTGGKHIDALQGKTPQISRFPEEWIASCALAFNPDRVTPGEGLSQTPDGRILRDIINDDPVTVLGKPVFEKYQKNSPLLLKLLDSAERLVIQVHPTVEFAKKRWNSNFGKTECWYMLNNGGSVYLGFKPGVTRAAWEQAFQTQNTAQMLSMLHHFKVQKGELVLVTGGVPHAIDKNSFMVELQEPTDLMVIPERVTPSGNRLADEKLHGGLGFNRMFDCFVYEGLNYEETKAKYFIAPKSIAPGVERLIGAPECDKFNMDKITVNGALTLPQSKTFCEGVVIAGQGSVNGHTLQTGNCFFAAANEPPLSFSGSLTVLICTPNVD